MGGNIDALRIPGRDVWAPDMEIYNSVEYGSGYFSEQMRERSQHAIIYPSGKVLYIPPVHGKVQCDDEKFADWPWGEYECHIKLGSWTYDGNTLNMTKYENKNYIDTEDALLASPKVIFTENSFKTRPWRQSTMTAVMSPTSQSPISLRCNAGGGLPLPAGWRTPTRLRSSSRSR